RQKRVEGRLRAIESADPGASQSIKEENPLVGACLLLQAVEHGERRGLLPRPVRRLGAKQANLGLRAADARQILERARSLAAIGRDAGQLEIGVGVPRIGLEDALEVRSRFLRVATDQVAIADVIKQRRRWRSLRKRLLVNSLRLATFLFRVEPRGLPEILGFRRREA